MVNTRILKLIPHGLRMPLGRIPPVYVHLRLVADPGLRKQAFLHPIGWNN